MNFLQSPILMRILWLTLSSFVCMVLVLLASLQLCEAAEGQKTPAIAFSAKIVGDRSRARLIVDFDRAVNHEAYLLDGPNRLIIELPETLFRLENDAQISSNSLITELRSGTIAQGKSRMVLSLDGPAVVDKVSFKEVSDPVRHRLIIDVIAAEPKVFEAALRQHDSQIKPVGLKTPSKVQYKIVIDPGHGGADGGAIGGNKTIEKDITLSVALKLRDRLEENPAFHVIMTREKDQFVALRDRVAVARHNRADLMISIHADSLRQHSIRGATVYTLSEEGSDEISRVLAKKQNRADLAAGLNLPDVEQKVTDILIDLTRRETAVFSNRFANLLVNKMKNDVQMIRNPHRSADFFVLKAPEIPSILLELGYLSNHDDEKLMNSVEWQDRTVARTKAAIDQFFARRLGQQ